MFALCAPLMRLSLSSAVHTGTFHEGPRCPTVSQFERNRACVMVKPSWVLRCRTRSNAWGSNRGPTLGQREE